MARATKGLDEIRREIDRIDHTMHGLLMERGQLIADLQAAKGVRGERGSNAMRPAREARMMRGLARRHDGPLPLLAVERIWREIISAFTQLQAGFAVYAAGGEPQVLAALGQFYFGVTTPLTLESSIQDTITRVETDVNAVGLIAAPLSEWWMDLASLTERRARIVAHYPFQKHAGAAPLWNHECWVVSQAPFDPSDNDRTLAVVSGTDGHDEDTIVEALAAQGLDRGTWRMVDQTHEAGAYFTLVDLDGYRVADEVTLAAPLEIGFLGGYGIAAAPNDANGK